MPNRILNIRHPGAQRVVNAERSVGPLRLELTHHQVDAVRLAERREVRKIADAMQRHTIALAALTVLLNLERRTLRLIGLLLQRRKYLRVGQPGRSEKGNE